MTTSAPATVLIPRFKKIVVRRDPPEEKHGSIIIPTQHQRKPHTGTITALGPDVDKNNLDLGLRVMFAEYSGTQFTIGTDNYIVMEQTEVIAVLQETTQEITADAAD